MKPLELCLISLLLKTFLGECTLALFAELFCEIVGDPDAQLLDHFVEVVQPPASLQSQNVKVDFPLFDLH